MNLVKIEENAHWYTQDGEPRHDATLRDARKEGLFPSVTSAIGIKAKPALDAWKQTQAILASLTLPRHEGESDDEFAKRVVEDSKSASKQAAEFGTAIHRVCEDYAKGNLIGLEPALLPFVKSYQEWFDENVGDVLGVEKILVNKYYGYAGTCDLHCILKDGNEAIVDIKTQGIKEGKKATFYPEWEYQLAAYAKCIPANPFRRLISIVINSTKPDDVAVKVWDGESRAWHAFLCCLDLWKIDRNYFPGEIHSSSPDTPAISQK